MSSLRFFSVMLCFSVSIYALKIDGSKKRTNVTSIAIDEAGDENVSLVNEKPLPTAYDATSGMNGTALILFDDYLYDRFNKSAKNEGIGVSMHSFNNVTTFVNEHFRLLYHFLYDLNNYINNIKYNTERYGRAMCYSDECQSNDTQNVPQIIKTADRSTACTPKGWNVPSTSWQPKPCEQTNKNTGTNSECPPKGWNGPSTSWQAKPCEPYNAVPQEQISSLDRSGVLRLVPNRQFNSSQYR